MLFFLTCNSCTKYNPSFYPSYDVLNPGEKVRRNPLTIVEMTDQGIVPKTSAAALEIGKRYFLVDEHFMQHYNELWREVERLRRIVK